MNFCKKIMKNWCWPHFYRASDIHKHTILFCAQNCKSWPYKTTLYTTVTLQQPRGSVAYERRIRWFFLVSTCFLIMLCLFMLLEIMCTVIIIFRATWKIKHTLEYKVTDQCLRIIKQILQNIKHLIFTSDHFLFK